MLSFLDDSVLASLWVQLFVDIVELDGSKLVGGMIKTFALTIRLPCFPTMRLLGILGGLLGFFLFLLFFLYSTSLCHQLLLILYERFHYVLRIDYAHVSFVIVMNQLSITSIGKGEESKIQLLYCPIIELGADSCCKHLYLILTGDVKSSEIGKEFYQSSLDPTNKWLQASLFLNGKHGLVSSAYSIGNGSRAIVAWLILDYWYQRGFLQPLKRG